MHVSRSDLPATVIGDYEGRSVDSGGIRIAFESMPVVARNMSAGTS